MKIWQTTQLIPRFACSEIILCIGLCCQPQLEIKPSFLQLKYCLISPACVWAFSCASWVCNAAFVSHGKTRSERFKQAHIMKSYPSLHLEHVYWAKLHSPDTRWAAFQLSLLFDSKAALESLKWACKTCVSLPVLQFLLWFRLAAISFNTMHVFMQ